LAEFTGERIIPGEVDQDLLNEHMARYAFAARFAGGKRVLDAGCGAGYGAAELAQTALAVTGVDVSADAIAYAREHYRLPNLRFEEASVTALPQADASLDLVVSFEVVEHLADWAAFLREVRRVLAPDGQFIVSTPNKLYYAETRQRTGPNPFHAHEFEFAEFRDELLSVFPNILLFLENHVDGVVFQPVAHAGTAEVRVEATDAEPAESHFFVAVCASRPQTGGPAFVYLPRAGNVLREREHHIALLEAELVTKNEWLEQVRQELAALNRQFHEQQEELERSNAWALALNRDLEAAQARIVEVQGELAREQAKAREKLAELEEENRRKTAWALETERRLGGELAARGAELVEAVRLLHEAEATVEERTVWARNLDAQVSDLQRRLRMYQASRWVRLGRGVGLGPKFAD
jgi:SAM-dependent methyltransferase